MIGSDIATTFRTYGERRGICFRLDLNPQLNLWSGLGPLVAPMQSVSVGGEVYHGTGQLTGLPSLNQLINGRAERVEFSLSMLKAEQALYVEAVAPSVRNCRLDIGWIVFGDDWQPKSDIVPLATCVADYVGLKVDTSADRNAMGTSTLVLSAHYGEVDRSRAHLLYWTPPHQKLVDPLDSACNFVFRMQPTLTVAWPRA